MAPASLNLDLCQNASPSERPVLLLPPLLNSVVLLPQTHYNLFVFACLLHLNIIYMPKKDVAGFTTVLRFLAHSRLSINIRILGLENLSGKEKMITYN